MAITVTVTESGADSTVRRIERLATVHARDQRSEVVVFFNALGGLVVAVFRDGASVHEFALAPTTP